MKLHLPVVLFTALMTVMTTLPSYARYSLKLNDKEVDVSDWSGKLSKEDPCISPYVFSDTLELGPGISFPGFDYLQDPESGEFYSMDLRIEKEGEGDSQTEVTFGHGRTFYIQAPAEKPTHVYIGKDCIFQFGDGKARLAAGAKQHSARNGSAVVDVYGTLRTSPESSESGVVFLADDGYEANGEIVIHAGGVLDAGGVGLMEEGADTKTSEGGGSDPEAMGPGLTVSQADRGGTMNTNIRVEQGGLIFARSLEIGKLPSSNSTAKANITLTLDGGRYYGYYKVEGDTDRIGACYKGSVSNTMIIVKNGGSFEGGKGSDISAVRLDTPKPVADTMDTTSSLKIIVTGEGSQFITDGSIGYVHKGSSSSSQPFKVQAKFDILVEKNSSFTFGGTYFGAQGYDDGAQEPTMDILTKIVVRDANFSITKVAARIGTPDKMTAKPNLRNSSYYTALELHGKSVLDVSGCYASYETVWDEEKGIWGDVLIGGGKIVLNNGDTGGAAVFRKGVIIYTDENYNGVVDLGGLDASKVTQEFTRKVWNESQLQYQDEILRGFRVGAAGTRITGFQEGTILTLKGSKEEGYDNIITIGSGSAALTKGGTSSDSGEKKNIIEFQGEGGTIQLADGCKVTLNFGEDEFLGELSGKENIEIQVYLTNAELSADDDVMKHFELGAGWGLSVKSYTVTENGDGILTLTGNTTGVANLDGTQSDFTGVSDADKVIVTGETTLTSTKEQGGILKRLQGEHNLTVKGEGEVELYNDGDLFNADGNTTFGGKLATEKGVTLKKTGEDSLTLGSLEAGGDVTVEEGKLVLTGDDNSIGGTLTLGEGGTLEVGQDGQLTLSGSVDGKGTGNLTGNGTVILDGDIEFGNVKLGEDLTIQMGEHCGSVDFGDTPVTLPDLKGEEVQGDVTVTGDGEFSGSFAGKLTVQGQQDLLGTQNGNCDLLVEGPKGQVSLAAGSTYRSVTNGGDPAETDRRGGKLVIAADENGSKAGAGIKVNGDIVFRNGAETDFKLNLSDPGLWGDGPTHDATMLSTEETIYIEKGTKFVIDCSRKGIVDAKGDLTHVVILEGQTIEEVEKYIPEKPSEESGVSAVSLSAEISSVEARVAEQTEGHQVDGAIVEGSALFNQLYERPTMWTDGKESWIDAKHREMSPLAFYATTSNSRSGLNLLWHDLNTKGLAQATEEVGEILTLLDGLVVTSPAEARRVMAAVAGSTLTSVSAAQSAALRNQMGRVRDHALQAARLRCAGNADEATAQQRPCKNSHVWVEGTSFFSEQHSVGDESGYRLNSWGGAVGIDAQVDAHWSVGVSLSAGYGDLEAHAADDAKGDLDTYTVSFWSQAKNGRWGNTLLFTLGTNEADLKRTVNYGAGSYTATSNASGSSLGAMWELTYDFHPVKENKSNILQPLFNVAVMHTSMDGFSEKNAGNVGLAAEKQTRDTVTLGLGLRWLAAINSAKAVNRTVSTEVHANVAQDLGDRRSVANVALLADPNFTQSVYGSKAGSTAFQFGAGVNVPVTPNSQIYVNAGGELREHANAWNAALGVRMGF